MVSGPPLLVVYGDCPLLGPERDGRRPRAQSSFLYAVADKFPTLQQRRNVQHEE